MHATIWTWLERVTTVTWPVTVELAFDATAILAIAGLVVLGLRAASAAMRHRAWTVAIVCLLILPLGRWLLPEGPVALWIPATEHPAGESSPTAADEDLSNPTASDALPRASLPAGIAESDPSAIASGDGALAATSARTWTLPEAAAEAEKVPSPPARPGLGGRDRAETGEAPLAVPWLAALALLWAAGLGLGLSSFARSLVAARRIVRNGETFRDPAWGRLMGELGARLGLRRAVAMVTSRQAAVPLTAGCLRPTIVLPAGCDAWPDDRRRVVLAHELVHVARRDVLWQMAARLACAIYWFHPLVWLAAWRLRVEREIACDDAVLSLGEQPSRYASHLLDVASSLSGRVCRPSTAVATVTGNSVEKRIRSILHPTLCRKPVGRCGACALAAGAGVVLMLVTLISPIAAPSEARAEPSANEPTGAEQERGPGEASDKAADTSKADTPENAGADPQAAVAGKDNGESSSSDAELAKQEQSAPDTPAIEDSPVVLQGVVTNPDGKPVAGASVQALMPSGAIAAPPADSQGRFRLEVPPSRVRGAILLAHGQDGSHQAMHDLGWEIDATEPVPAVQLVLRPARVIQARVVDAKQRPVAGASLGATAWYRRVAAARSDEQGRATLRVPAGATLKYVYAHKAKVGLDYLAYPDPIASEESAKAPEEPAEPHEQVTLTLDGAITVRVRLIDPENRPLVGIQVYPWYFQKPDKPDDFNVSSLAEVKLETDARGVATFDFVPASNQGRITFWPRTPKHWPPQRPMYDPQSGQGELTVRMVRKVRVSGRVRLPDGRPAEGIRVEAGGAGHQDDRFAESARTDAKGQFELLVYPDQIYMFAVIDPKWGAPLRDRIVVRPDTPVDGIDFQLAPGTKVHGRVIVGRERKPLADQYMEVYQYGTDLDGLPEDPRLPNPTGNRVRVRPLIVRWTRTDAEGRYEFCLGPGNYDVRGPAHTEIQKFSVEDQKSIAFDFRTPRPDMGIITGRVVRREDSQPVAGAEVVGIPITKRGHADLRETTDEQGRFRKEHWLDETLFYVETSRGLKGLVVMPVGEQDVTIPVQPVASARGRLVDATGEPIPDRRIEYGIRVVFPGESLQHRFGGSIRTDAAGRFVIEGLVAGQEYHLQLPLHTEDDRPPGWSWRDVGTFTAQGPGTTDVGDFQ